jgi:hypothetical protein
MSDSSGIRPKLLYMRDSNPAATHFTAAMHVLHYLKGTHNLCNVYKRQPGTVNMLVIQMQIGAQMKTTGSPIRGTHL